MQEPKDIFDNLEELEEDESTICGKSESESEPPKTRRLIYSDKLDPSISVLYQNYKDGELDLRPMFQRRPVWDNKRSSKLIESVLLEVPLPVFYLAQNANDGQEVIDGQQRLKAFFRFMDNEYSLTGLAELDELNGLCYKDLERSKQRLIKNYPVHTIVFKKESDENLRFQVFERLNTGAVPLNAQELRNCIYRGKYNELLIRLSSNSDYMAIMGFNGPEKRMRDVEYVLRFCSFFHTNYLDYKPSMDRFMNEDMRKFINISNENEELLNSVFRNSVSLVRSLFGKHAFKRFYRGEDGSYNGRWEAKKFNASLFDILMWSMTRYDKNRVMAKLDMIREAFIELMTNDQNFIDSIELSTSSSKAVTIRFDKWRLTLDSIMKDTSRQDRCFSLALKEKLYNTNPQCEICNQHINDIDDAAVDHTKMYGLGGETIEDNARLTHRYCNWARSKKE